MRTPQASISALLILATTFTAARAGSPPSSQPTVNPATPAQNPAHRAPATAPAPSWLTPPVIAASAPSKPKPLRGPIYLPLRYDEDYSYLDGPSNRYKHDFFDPIKNIHLDKDWRLSLGGEIRERMDVETNRNFGTRDPTTGTYLLQRTVLHADLQYRSTFRAYVEGADARVFQRELPQTPGQENAFDLKQAFFDLRMFGDNTPLVLRAGRQEMVYGYERVIGRSDWTNSTRNFDGFKLMYQSKPLDVDFFWMRPIVFVARPGSNSYTAPIYEGLNRKPDHYREQTQFFGTYATYKAIPNHRIEYYMLGLTDNGSSTNANGRTGDLTLYTIGGRFSGESHGFDYDVEGNGQWGTFAHAEDHAWMVATDDGYTLKSVPATPRLGVGFDYASGDDTPRDSAHETYNQLFPATHRFLGYIDLVGRANVMAPNINLSIKPVKDVTAKITYYHFWLASDEDALYNKQISVSRRDVSGYSGQDVGDELDVVVYWQMDVHNALMVGESHFWPGSIVNHTGYSRDADFFYLQWQYKF